MSRDLGVSLKAKAHVTSCLTLQREPAYKSQAIWACARLPSRCRQAQTSLSAAASRIQRAWHVYMYEYEFWFTREKMKARDEARRRTRTPLW